MMISFRVTAPLAFCAVLAACDGGNPFSGPGSTTPEPITEDNTFDPSTEPPLEDDETIEIGAGGASAATLDTATEAEKAAATRASVPAGGLLGETVASLGDPTKPGFWLMTPLVTTEQEGRVERQGGAVAQVTLIPSDGPAGGGSQISLSAMRALDLNLTDLATLKVYSS